MMRPIGRFVAVAIVLSLAAACGPAAAKGFLYAGKRKKINCGVLAIRQLNTVRNADEIAEVGSLFYWLDQSPLKPAGWSFDNPLGVSLRAGAMGNQRVDRSSPDYWVVELAGLEDMSRFQLLYLPAKGNQRLSDQDRERLRRFVDGGGVLWIDNAGTQANPLDFQETFFIRGLSFQQKVGYDSAVNRHHPLISMPYWLSEMEVARLGAAPGQCVVNPGYDPLSTWSSYAEAPTEFSVLFPVVSNSASLGGSSNRRLPSVAANAYGSGFIVATATYVGRGCFSQSAENGVPSYKFAYNVVSWASSSMSYRKDYRRSGSSIDAIGGSKLVEHWLLGAPPSSADRMGTGAAVYKNVAFYSSGNTLFALDVFPSQDLDQDGNPDDGLADGPATGVAYGGQDIVWMWSPAMGGGQGAVLSAPSVVSVQDPRDPGSAVDGVLVQDSGGVVHLLEAFPHDPNTGRLLDSTGPLTPINMTTAATDHPTAPVYVNGWIYAVGGDGRLWAYSPSIAAWKSGGTGRQADHVWSVPSDFSANDMNQSNQPQPRSGPAFGFVKNNSSGAVVGMVYWFVSSVNTSVSKNDFVYGVPVYVANDRPKTQQKDQEGLVHQLTISYRDGNVSSSPKPKVWIRTPAGAQQVDESDIYYRGRSGFEGMPPGIIEIRDTEIPPEGTVYAEYALDYVQEATTLHRLILPRVRSQLEPRSASSQADGMPATEIVGTPAMGADGLMFVNGGRQGSGGAAGGSVYGLFNDGSSQANKWHYLMYSSLTVPSSSGQGQISVVPGAISVPALDVGGLPVSMMNAQPVGSPAVTGDKVFVLVKGDPAPNAPTAALLCFKAKSDFVIRITENAGYDSNGQPIKKAKRLRDSNGRARTVRIWQPNVIAGALSTADLQPLATARPVPTHMIDHDRGTIVFDNFDSIKLQGSGPRAAYTSIFTSSMPVWVYLDNIEVPIDWSTWGPTKQTADWFNWGQPPSSSDSVDLSQWNNLLWYYPVPQYAGQECSDLASSPVVIGNTVYFTAQYNEGDILYAVDSDTGETGGKMVKDEDALLWQQLIPGSGLQSGSDASVSAANGVLLAPAGDGLHAFTNATTLVADSNRVVELDGGGEIAWSLDSINWPAAVPQNNNSPVARRSGPVNKPARARYLGLNEVLVVNSGANSVCRVNRSGAVDFNAFGDNSASWFVRWVYDKFCDPADLLRPGQPTSLRSPTDAIFWQEMEALPGQDNAFLLAIHCLIADSGNHRIVDLVYRLKDNLMVDKFGNAIPGIMAAPDRYDSASGFLLPELNWVTKTDSMNERYSYDCIQIIDGNQVWAAISNYRTGTDFEAAGVSAGQGLGGAIVALGYRLRSEPSSPWNYMADKSGEIIARCDRVQWGGRIQPLAMPRYFDVVDQVINPSTFATQRFMYVCDNYGVYKVKVAGAVPTLERALLDVDYRRMGRQMEQDNGVPIPSPGEGLGIPLYATSVQELPNGHWLIANGYSGKDKMAMPGAATYTGPANSFMGEVFEFDPTRPPDESAVVWYSPKLVVPGIKLIDGGFDYDPQVRNQRLDNSYIPQQHRSAQRRF